MRFTILKKALLKTGSSLMIGMLLVGLSLPTLPLLAQTQLLEAGDRSRAREFTRGVWGKTKTFFTGPTLEEARQKTYGDRITPEQLTERQRQLLEEINQKLKELRGSLTETTDAWAKQVAAERERIATVLTEEEARRARTLDEGITTLEPNAKGVYSKPTNTSAEPVIVLNPFTEDFFPNAWQNKLTSIDNLWLEFRRETVRISDRDLLSPSTLQRLQPTATLIEILDLATHQQTTGQENLWSQLSDQTSFVASAFGNLSSSIGTMMQQLVDSGLVSDPRALRDPVSGGVDLVALRRELQRVCEGDHSTLPEEIQLKIKEWTKWLEIIKGNGDKIARLLSEALLANNDDRFAATRAERFKGKSAGEIRLRPFWVKAILGTVPNTRMSSPVREVLRSKGWHSAEIFALNMATAFPHNVGAGIHFMAAKIVADTLGSIFGFAPKALPRFADSMAHIEQVFMLGLNLTGFYYANWGAEIAIDRVFKKSMATFSKNFNAMQGKWLKLPGSELQALTAAEQSKALLAMSLRAGVSLAAVMSLMDGFTLYFSHPDRKEADYLDGLGMHTEANTIRSRIHDETWRNGVFATSTIFNAAYFAVIPTLLTMGTMKVAGAAGWGAAFGAEALGGPITLGLGLVAALAGHAYLNEHIFDPWRENSIADDQIKEKIENYNQLTDTLISNATSGTTLYDKLDRLLQKLKLDQFFKNEDPAEERKTKTSLLQAMIDDDIVAAINNITTKKFIPPSTAPPANMDIEHRVIQKEPEDLLAAQPQLKILVDLYRFHLNYQVAKGNRKHIEAVELEKKIRSEAPELFTEDYKPSHEFLAEISSYKAAVNLLGTAFDNYRNLIGFKEVAKVEEAWTKKQKEINNCWEDATKGVFSDLLQYQKLPSLIAAAYLDRSSAEKIATATDVTIGYRLDHPQGDPTIRFLGGKSPLALNSKMISYWSAQDPGLMKTHFDGVENPRESLVFQNVVRDSTLFQQLQRGETNPQHLKLAAKVLGHALFQFAFQHLTELKELELTYEQEQYTDQLQSAVAQIDIGNDKEEEALRKQIIVYDLGRDHQQPEEQAFENEIAAKAESTTGNWQYHLSMHAADRTTNWSTLLSAEQSHWADNWWKIERRIDGEATEDGLPPLTAETLPTASWIANDQRFRLYSSFVNGLRLSHLIRWIRGQKNPQTMNLETYLVTQANYYFSGIYEVDQKLENPLLELVATKALTTIEAYQKVDEAGK